ncbi:hypothetical protein BCR33DRAFT_715442, partial [Rhizoclosmatium globosum]
NENEKRNDSENDNENYSPLEQLAIPIGLRLVVNLAEFQAHTDSALDVYVSDDGSISGFNLHSMAEVYNSGKPKENQKFVKDFLKLESMLKMKENLGYEFGFACGPRLLRSRQLAFITPNLTVVSMFTAWLYNYKEFISAAIKQIGLLSFTVADLQKSVNRMLEQEALDRILVQNARAASQARPIFEFKPKRTYVPATASVASDKRQRIVALSVESGLQLVRHLKTTAPSSWTNLPPISSKLKTPKQPDYSQKITDGKKAANSLLIEEPLEQLGERIYEEEAENTLLKALSADVKSQNIFAAIERTTTKYENLVRSLGWMSRMM